MSYADFLASKAVVAPDSGRQLLPADLGGRHLAEFQQALTAWAVRKGRAALFAGTGLGKTRMSLTWAVETGERTLLLAPLAVGEQTVGEAERIGLEAVQVRDQAGADQLPVGVTAVTNYERLHLFDPSRFGAVVLDESSILKAFSGTTKRALIAAFKDTPWRLACTATPAPNDIEELCNHADFLGVMSAQEMRSTFFIADSRGEFMRYRLKGHAREAFYRWLASWAMSLDRPSDLGFSDEGYNLPPLDVRPVVVESGWTPDDALFSVRLNGVSEQAQVRRATLGARVEATAVLTADEPDKQWLLWCGLNDEQDRLAKMLGDDAVSIDSRTPPDERIELERRWRRGDVRILISKPSIFGWGMNWQHCSRMAFVGIGYSYEQYHQAIRRCWRFGQTNPVHAHIVVSDTEEAIYETVLAKERAAQRWRDGLVREVVELERNELLAGTSAGDDYEPRRVLSVPSWLHTKDV